MTSAIASVVSQRKLLFYLAAQGVSFGGLGVRDGESEKVAGHHGRGARAAGRDCGVAQFAGGAGPSGKDCAVD